MLKLGEWPLLAIALSIYLIIFALVLIGVKGTELCHRQKKMGIFFMFISLNIVGLFWANKIFKKENPNFKFWKTIRDIFKIKRKNKKIAV